MNFEPSNDFNTIKQNKASKGQCVVLGISYECSDDTEVDKGLYDEEDSKLNFNLIFQKLGVTNWFLSLNQTINQIELPLLLDIYSKINFTYRYKFTPIPRSIEGPSPINFQSMFRENPLNVIENVLNNPDCFNSDIGWGCMIRTGQTLLANTIQRIKLGRNFTFPIDCEDSESNNDKYIISLFQDNPKAPFSLHKFVQVGNELSNMKPGQSFGPSATARCIQKLIYDYPQCGIDKCIVSISSGDISKPEIDSIYENDKNSKTLILLGIKLGIHTVNEYYWEDLLNLLSTKFSVGIAGGRPSSSLYIFGFEQISQRKYKDSQLLYFDPHRSQQSLDDENGGDNIDYKTCHTINYGKLELKDMDPPMLVGILLESLTDWISWQKFASNCKIFNIISTTINNTIWDDDESIDIESLKSDDIDIVEGQLNASYNNNNNNGVRLENSSEENSTVILEEKDDENMDINILSQHNTLNRITMDYVDAGSLSYNTPKSFNETFESIQCKDQKIMFFDQDKSFDRIKDVDVEIEKVLVESDSIEPTTVL